MEKIAAENPVQLLLIDDHEALAHSLAAALRYSNYAVEVALSYHQALEKISRQPFDLILSDVDLGVHSGIELIRDLPARTISRPVPPLIFMTGNLSYLHRKELSPYPVLAKPFSIRRLLEMLETHFLQPQGT
ncbi:MAG: response regulator [Verrucomicrobiota bacterium]